MRKIKLLKMEINVSLKSFCLILMLILILLIGQGCKSGPIKTNVEIWLIDEEDNLLYRRKDDNIEYVIPIKNNPEVERFLCIPSENFDEIIKSQN